MSTAHIISCVLLVLWFVQTIRLIRAKRRLKRLENTNTLRLQHPRLRLKTLELAIEVDSLERVDYQDKDGDGVPDVFHRRKPVSEILEFEKDSKGHANDYWIALELPARPPIKGEYFLCGNMIIKATHDYVAEFLVIKSVPGSRIEDLVDLTRETLTK